MIDEQRHAIGLARDVGSAVAGRAQRLAGEFGYLREAIFAVECGPDGAAHQAAAGNGREHGRGQPSDRDTPAIDRLLDVAVEAERRLVAQFDVGRRDASAAPVVPRFASDPRSPKSPRERADDLARLPAPVLPEWDSQNAPLKWRYHDYVSVSAVARTNFLVDG
jgi:hypothetical protein